MYYPIHRPAPEFAERVKRSGQLLSYRLTARGQRLLELLNLINKPEIDRNFGDKNR